MKMGTGLICLGVCGKRYMNGVSVFLITGNLSNCQLVRNDPAPWYQIMKFLRTYIFLISELWVGSYDSHSGCLAKPRMLTTVTKQTVVCILQWSSVFVTGDGIGF